MCHSKAITFFHLFSLLPCAVLLTSEGTATPPHPGAIVTWLDTVLTEAAAQPGSNLPSSTRTADLVQLVRAVWEQQPASGSEAAPAAANTTPLPPVASNLIHETPTLAQYYQELLMPFSKLVEEDEKKEDEEAEEEKAATEAAAPVPDEASGEAAAASAPTDAPVPPPPSPSALATPTWKPYAVVVCSTPAAAWTLAQAIEEVAAATGTTAPYAVIHALPQLAAANARTAPARAIEGGAATSASTSLSSLVAVSVPPSAEDTPLAKASVALPRGRRITPVVVAAPVPTSASDPASLAAPPSDTSALASDAPSPPKALVPAATLAAPSATLKFLEGLESAVSAGTAALASAEVGAGSAHVEGAPSPSTFPRTRPPVASGFGGAGSSSGSSSSKMPPSPPRKSGGWGFATATAATSGSIGEGTSPSARPAVTAGSSVSTGLGALSSPPPAKAFKGQQTQGSDPLSPALASLNWRAPRTTSASDGRRRSGAASILPASGLLPSPAASTANAAPGSAFDVGGSGGEGAHSKAAGGSRTRTAGARGHARGAPSAAAVSAAVAAVAEAEGQGAGPLPRACSAPSSPASSVGVPTAPPPSRVSDTDCHTTRSGCNSSNGSGGSSNNNEQAPPPAASAAPSAPHVPPAPTPAPSAPKTWQALYIPTTLYQPHQSAYYHAFVPTTAAAPGGMGEGGGWHTAGAHHYGVMQPALPPAPAPLTGTAGSYAHHPHLAHHALMGGHRAPHLSGGYMPQHQPLPSAPPTAGGYMPGGGGSMWYPSAGGAEHDTLGLGVAASVSAPATTSSNPSLPAALPGSAPGKVWLSVDAHEALAYLFDPRRCNMTAPTASAAPALEGFGGLDGGAGVDVNALASRRGSASTEGLGHRHHHHNTHRRRGKVQRATAANDNTHHTRNQQPAADEASVPPPGTDKTRRRGKGGDRAKPADGTSVAAAAPAAGKRRLSAAAPPYLPTAF